VLFRDIDRSTHHALRRSIPGVKQQGPAGKHASTSIAMARAILVDDSAGARCDRRIEGCAYPESVLWLDQLDPRSPGSANVAGSMPNSFPMPSPDAEVVNEVVFEKSDPSDFLRQLDPLLARLQPHLRLTQVQILARAFRDIDECSYRARGEPSLARSGAA